MDFRALRSEVMGLVVKRLVVCQAVGLLSLVVCFWLGGWAMMGELSPKSRSAFFHASLLQRLRQNIARYRWAQQTAQRIVQDAQLWLQMSDDELWSLMFGPTITRSWHVWSNGYCPACKKPVPMYNWRVDALRSVGKFNVRIAGNFSRPTISLPFTVRA